MGGLLGGGSNAQTENVVASLRFQTSQSGGVIPLVYGTTRLSINLIEYDDFTAAGGSGKGKGGGGGKAGAQTSYSASVIMGLCQGPVTGIGTVWWDKNVGTLASIGATLYAGNDGQAADSYWSTKHADEALGYSGTANLVANNYNLGSSASLPNFSFEVSGVASASGVNGLDANPAAIVGDFLTNPRYGAGFPAVNLGDLSGYSTYCQAVGLFLSPALDAQQEAQQHLADLAQLTNSAIVWSGGLLKIVPYGDEAVTGNGATFTPDTTPVYSLDDDDFIIQSTSVGTSSGVTPGGPALRTGAGAVTDGFSDDPVHVARSTPADADNAVQLEYLDRTNAYNTAIVEASDQAAIDLYGIRRNTSLNAHAICDGTVAAVVAHLVLQRQLLFRNTYTFKLGWNYCLLEPMDLVQISDARLGLATQTVRVTAVEEDDEGVLSITAEDFFGGYSTAVLYPKQAGSGYALNANSDPGDVNQPVIFEPPAALTAGDLEIWVALSGGPNWGSAQVWISSDGSSYAFAGNVAAPARQGVTTADLPAASSPDTTDTLAVDLSESRGQLNSVSAADAANLVSLCWLGGELLAYETATLTTAYQYGLTTLYRGAFGSTLADHPAGTQFARIDGAVGRFPYPASLVGQTIYLKFLSANLVGGGTQELSAVSAYSYTVTGAGRSPTSVVTGSFNGAPTASLVLQRYIFTDAVTFPAGLAGSRASAGDGATATTSFAIARNGTAVGTMDFAAGATTASFTMATATSFAAGDVLTLTAPAAPDATLADLAWTFQGTM
jgi:Putative phage tail protein